MSLLTTEGARASRLQTLYLLHSAAVRRYAWGITHRREVADDVTQDVFLRALEGLGSYRGRDEEIRAWLFAIARNRAYDYVRVGRRCEPQDAGVISNVLSEVGPAGPDWGATTPVHAILADLPALQQQVLTLRYRDGLGVTETAAELSRTNDAIRHLEHRAFKRLRQRLALAALSTGTFAALIGTDWLLELV